MMAFFFLSIVRWFAFVRFVCFIYLFFSTVISLLMCRAGLIETLIEMVCNCELSSVIEMACLMFDT